MTLREILIEKQAALCQRWLGTILAGYGQVTALRWQRERDPFANPIGHAFRSALPSLLEAVAGEGEPGAEAAAALEDLVRIRCVQELAPSKAVGFVRQLRDAIRAELAAELAGGQRAEELAMVEERIERLGLLAFDAYVRCREQMFRLRLEEARRSVGSILRRWHGELPGEAEDAVRLAPLREGARR